MTTNEISAWLCVYLLGVYLIKITCYFWGTENFKEWLTLWAWPVAVPIIFIVWLLN